MTGLLILHIGTIISYNIILQNNLVVFRNYIVNNDYSFKYVKITEIYILISLKVNIF